MDSSLCRIGTRDSLLARWQAHQVTSFLENLGVRCCTVPVKSEGDLDLVTPLYAMGTQGVFTKTLDAYLLSHKIDLAVHSMKDVPTSLAKGIRIAAVLSRGNTADSLVFRNEAAFNKFGEAVDSESRQALEGTIATGSVRRKAQLLHRFPRLQVEDLRGNVQTRLKKLYDSNWDAAVFAAAGLERLEERPEFSQTADWMLPAPAQGAILVVCREDDLRFNNELKALNHPPTEICVHAERQFLKSLMGGCSTPIAALARLEEQEIHFTGSVTATDGKKQASINRKAALENADTIGRLAAETLLKDSEEEIRLVLGSM